MSDNHISILFISAIILLGSIGIASQSRQAPSSAHVDTAFREATLSQPTSSSTRKVASVRSEIQHIEGGMRAVKDHIAAAHAKREKSTLFNVIDLYRGGAKESSVDMEYISFSLPQTADSSINISGWRLTSSMTRKSTYIGQGSYRPKTGRKNEEEPIILHPGDRVIVHSGHSPIGVSFRTNICSGYLEQLTDFVPRLRKQCPYAISDIPTSTPKTSSCSEYIQGIPLCHAAITTPNHLSDECRRIVTDKINYNGCVERNKNNEGFDGNQWRVFLKRDNELWKNKHEVIMLLDSGGNLVDVIAY